MTPAAVPPLVGEFPSLPDALDAALISATEDRKEGVRSFIEGRSPNFIGD